MIASVAHRLFYMCLIDKYKTVHFVPLAGIPSSFFFLIEVAYVSSLFLKQV